MPLSGGTRVVWGNTVVWGNGNVVWTDPASWGQAIVWGNSRLEHTDESAIVWGNGVTAGDVAWSPLPSDGGNALALANPELND